VIGELGALGPLWPILFVTIACGAISGWHSLVSSSGTARQLEKEGDALFVGGGSMFLEMFVAILSLLAAVVGTGSLEQYVAWGGGASVFKNGLAVFLNQIGVPITFGQAYGGVFLTLMALTIMYLVVRFMRVASAEFLGEQIPVLRNVHVGTIIALVFSAILIWTGFWSRIWVLFGGANQLMASLALLIVSLWLMSRAKSYYWALIPFAFMFITTIAALIITGWNSFKAVDFADAGAAIGNIIAGGLAVILIVCALILAWDGIQALLKYRSGAAKPSEAGGGE
jgi:carbon starvation protein